MTGNLLLLAIIFLAGALFCVILSKKIGLSSVIGYLLAGVLLGPYVLGFIGEEGKDILHFAEFGVVVMLFLIGLEIEPRNFWNMKKTIIGMGSFQVFFTILLSFLLFYNIGYDFSVSIVISMAVALSSTAIAMQTIKEKDMMNTNFGISGFSILLFQDIIVIFMLGMLPLLANTQEHPIIGNDVGHQTFLDYIPLGLQTATIILSILAIVVGGKYFVSPLLHKVAKTDVREMLIAAAFLIVFAISYLMEYVGLSPALGAFLGGVVLSNSEFKHELESILEPFKNLLLGLFFMAVGASINFYVIAKSPWTITGILFAVIFLKAIVLYLAGKLFKLKIDQKLLLTISLAQIGEFAFVLLSFAFGLNIINQEVMDMMLVITALTMSITPILSIINERLILPNFGTKESVKKKMDNIDKSEKIILLGFGEFGSVIGRFLRTHGVEATILDHDSNRVDFLRKMGFDVYYGDATRMDLLESAGIQNAKILISAIDNPNVTLEIVHMLIDKYPKLELMVRAKNRNVAYELVNLGVENIYRESVDTALTLAKDVLSRLGFRRYTLNNQAYNFIRYDKEILKRLAKEHRYGDELQMIKEKQELEEQEKILNEDLERQSKNYSIDWEHNHKSDQANFIE